MVVCQVCSREFQNEHGLYVHLARAHDVHGTRGRLPLKVIHRFFPRLKKRKWRKAKRFLKRVVGKDIEDAWIKGYVQALRGMIVTLRVDHSPPQPFIFKLSSYHEDQLEGAREEFIKLSEKPLYTEFDGGYFQAWADYTYYLLHQRTGK